MSNAMPAMMHLFGGGMGGSGSGNLANLIKPKPGGDVVPGKPAPNQNEDTFGNIFGKVYNQGWAALTRPASQPLGEGASVWPNGGPGAAGKTLLGS